METTQLIANANQLTGSYLIQARHGKGFLNRL